MTINPMAFPPATPPPSPQKKSSRKLWAGAGAVCILLAGGVIGFAAAPTPEPVTHTQIVTKTAPPMPDSCQSAFKKAEETFLEFEEFTVVVGDAVQATDGKNYLMSLYEDGITAQRTLISASIKEYVEAKVLCEDETGLSLPTAAELEQYKR